MPITGPSFEQLLDRIDQQDRVIAELQQRLDAAPPAAGVPAWPASSSAANSAYGTSNGTNWAATGEPTCGTPKPPTVYAPLVGDADNGKCPPCGEEKKLKKQHVVTHYVGYDKGFVIKPFNSKEYPFDMKINGRIQFRYNGFARNEETWTDNAGVTREIRNRSDFDIERARLILSGTALDERSTYYLQLDGDTDGSDMVDFFDYWWAWKFSDLLQVQVGKRKVAACRAWLLSAFNTTLVDRSMATDFFRPDRTVGIWFVGDLTENMHYEAMVGNGYRTADMPLSQQNDKFAYAATQWIDLGDGAFGNSFDDYEMHDTPVMQLGHSFAAAQQGDTFGGIPLDESDFVRLSDGTVLDAPSALAPGTRVTDFDLYFYAIDAAFKYRGFAINGELCFRWIDNIGGNGPFPVDKLYDRGFYAQTSYYLVPETLYVAGRVSQVDGAYGNHYEYAGGVGWFLSGNRNQKLTFDVTVLDGSPLNNTTTDILVGDSGLLCRAQYQAMF
ncbi:MAG: hypothetical protein KDA63_06920 [Planctomycetales bacterium]|nr:hypothetical protein [Planctomycetales bacterium]